MKVCQTTIHVNDMDQAVDFYENKLGFEVLTKDHYPFVVVLRHESFPIVLHKVEKSSPVDYANVNHTVLAFQTNDIGADFSQLKAKGVNFVHDAPQPFPAGKMAAFRDPAGNVHELIQYSG